MQTLLLLILIVAVLAFVVWLIYSKCKQEDKSSTLGWLAGADTFAETWTLESELKPWEWEWDALAQSRVPLITHCPNNAEFLRRAHALGVRCFPYVQFYYGADSLQGDAIHALGSVYQGFQYASADVKWRPDDPLLHVTGTADGSDGDFYPVCQNIDVFASAMVKWVDHVMSLGFDGVYIDCVSDKPAGCYGASLGNHVHQIPDPDPATPAIANQAYAALLKRVHDVVHSYNGLVIGNTCAHDSAPNNTKRLTNLYAPFWQHMDAGFVEGYLYPVGPVGSRALDTGAWIGPLLDDAAWAAEWSNWISLETPPAFQSGSLAILASTDINQYICLARYAAPYPGLPADLIASIPDYGIYIGKRDYAFLSYATARLAGFVWNAATYISHSSVADLYRLRLGRPLTPKLVADQVHYRVFECGIVAVNANPVASAPLPNIGSGPWGSPPTLLVDAFIAGLPGRLFKNYSGGTDHYATLPPDQFQIPPISGRVYLFASDMTYLQT